MPAEKEFSNEDSLKLINEMIGRAKKSYVTKGTAAVVWGVLIVICSLITWAQIQFKFDLPFDIWWLTVAALVTQVYFAIKEKKTKNFVSHDENVMTYVWSTFGICIFILSFYNSKFGTQDSSSLIMMLYGIPTFITGGVFKFRPMILGGLICWVATIISIFTASNIDMLLMAACGLFAWLIPGIILWKKYKKQQACNV